MKPSHPLTPEEEINIEIRRKTIKAFALFGLAGFVPFGVWKYIKNQPKTDGVENPLRNILEVNGKLSKSYFSQVRLAPTFNKSEAAKKPKVNGREGLKKPIDLTEWSLKITSDYKEKKIVSLNIDQIKSLPKHEVIFEFKCIEGWSQVMHWGGARLCDLMETYKLGTRDGSILNNSDFKNLFKYVGMETPDKEYFVGIDMESALHPQTLLCYELNGKPLSQDHGFPLRLIIPVKYGVKNIKRIGNIIFTDNRPADYWAELGYDYFGGL